MKNKIYLSLSVLFLFFLSFSVLPSQTYLDQAKKDIETLASPQMAGRGFYEDGHLKAAEYIRDRYIESGLESITEDYFQAFEMNANVIEDTPVLIINGKELVPGIDFIPLAVSGSGEGDEISKVVRAGCGLLFPEKGLNDYKKHDIIGAVVILDSNIPDSIKSDTSIAKELYSKSFRVEICKRMGAEAVIFLEDRLSFGAPYYQENMPVFDLKSDVLPEKIESISFEIETGYDEYETNNVLGLLHGSEYPDSLIIICGHYDHVGSMGDDHYFPGANDNASGIAFQLALADYFSKKPLKYSILFVAFSGEEYGLRGSRYFAEHPPVDLGRCKFLLNFDMCASGDDGKMAVGGIDFPYYYELLQTVNDSLGLHELRKRKNAPNGDHFPITSSGVLGFYIYPFSGLQPYHHVKDVPETLEWNVFTKLYRLGVGFLERL